jgi:hypothetical protein
VHLILWFRHVVQARGTRRLSFVGSCVCRWIRGMATFSRTERAVGVSGFIGGFEALQARQGRVQGYQQAVSDCCPRPAPEQLRRAPYSTSVRANCILGVLFKALVETTEAAGAKGGRYQSGSGPGKETWGQQSSFACVAKTEATKCWRCGAVIRYLSGCARRCFSSFPGGGDCRMKRRAYEHGEGTTIPSRGLRASTHPEHTAESRLWCVR